MHHHIETQLSIEVANTPGEIARISDLLSAHNIVVNAMSIADESGRGYFRFLTEDVEEAESVLRDSDFKVARERVISVNLDDQKGRLARITRALAQANINIDYFYASVDDSDSAMRLIMKVENVLLATNVLDEITEGPVGSSALSLA